MSFANRLQCPNIPLVIDGKAKFVKGVTKDTTCDDIISKLPRAGYPRAIFQTTNGTEKELAGKTKLMKIWRSHGSSKKAMFVVKQSEGRKTRRMSLNIFGARNSRKSLEPASGDKLKQVSDLAFYVQYQKSKLHRMTNADEHATHGNMSKVKSTASMDSMDAFLAQADHQKLGQFLDFCSGVTAQHLGDTPKVKHAKSATPQTKLDSAVISHSLRNMKLGFKKRLASKLSFVSKTTSASTIKTSASTIKSADTGYQSQTSDMRSQASVTSKPRLPLKEDSAEIPLHSTPVTCTTKRKRDSADDTFDVTLTAPKAPRFDEVEGKSLLMERFMNDTTVCEANKTVSRSNRNNSKSSVYTSAPVFRSQEEKCRYYWDQNCDSDSDTSCTDDDLNATVTDLDEAFVEEDFDDVSPFSDFADMTPRKLRRESAVSNLNKADMFIKPFEDTCYDMKQTEQNNFDYSFNCSFPEFLDTQDFSLDYSCSDSESDVSCSFDDGYFRRVKDSDIYSFMKSSKSLAILDKSRYLSRDLEEKQSEAGSDEGLGSMTSDCLSEQELFF